MRLFKNPQMKIGEIRIEDIPTDRTSKDDVPRLLVGLQSIYSDKELLKKISDIMITDIVQQRLIKKMKVRMDFCKFYCIY